jgi:hypothetical protein
MRDVAIIDATPAVRIARPTPMQLVHPGTPAVEREIYPITPVGPQRNVLPHRRYLSASKDLSAQRFDHGLSRPPFWAGFARNLSRLFKPIARNPILSIIFWIGGAGYFLSHWLSDGVLAYFGFAYH